MACQKARWGIKNHSVKAGAARQGAQGGRSLAGVVPAVAGAGVGMPGGSMLTPAKGKASCYNQNPQTGANCNPGVVYKTSVNRQYEPLTEPGNRNQQLTASQSGRRTNQPSTGDTTAERQRGGGGAAGNVPNKRSEPYRPERR